METREDRWLEERAAEVVKPGQALARVTAVDRDAFLVRVREVEHYAELAGRFRFEACSAADLPSVGDWVAAQCGAPGDVALIHDVLPRRSFLRRKRPGKSSDVQMIAANIDVAFIVQGCHYDFNLRRLDRYLVIASDGRIEPRIILTKTDLVSRDELSRLVETIRNAGIGCAVIPVSGTTGEGMEEFRASLEAGKTYCLLGSSGVGKTTLINRLRGSEALETRMVSGTGEGVHTTVRRQMILLECGALLIDTPGMRELGMVAGGDGMDEVFGDIAEFAVHCRFADCAHAEEPGCAVRTALETGELDEQRFRSYVKLRKEAEFHAMSYVEKRQKDRTFGRSINTSLKRLARIKNRDEY